LGELGDVLAMKLDGQRLDERMLGLDAVAVLLKGFANRRPVAFLDRDDDGLGAQPAAKPGAHGAVDLRVGSDLSEHRRSEPERAEGAKSGERQASQVHDALLYCKIVAGPQPEGRSVTLSARTYDVSGNSR